MPPQRPCGSSRGRVPTRSFSRPTTVMRMSAVGGKAASAEAGPQPSSRTTRYSSTSPLSAKALVALSGGRAPERTCSIPLPAMKPLVASSEQSLKRHHSFPPASMDAMDSPGGATAISTETSRKEYEQAGLRRKVFELRDARHLADGHVRSTTNHLSNQRPLPRDRGGPQMYTKHRIDDQGRDKHGHTGSSLQQTPSGFQIGRQTRVTGSHKVKVVQVVPTDDL